MLEAVKKIPAGTFLVPLIISAVLYTLFPGYLEIGGSTEWLLTDAGTGFIVAAIVFFSGTLVNIHSLVKILKQHGILILVKTIIAFAICWLYLQLFGYDGIFGISILALVLCLTSFNPSMYMSLSQEYGTTEDLGAFGLLSVFCLPIYPMIVYGLMGTQSSLDYASIISTLIPLILGMVLGNIDTNINRLFGPGISILLPILGWNIGYGMNLIDAFQAIIPGLILALVFYLFMSPMYFTDVYVLKNNGITGLMMTCGAGLSVSYAPVLAETYPALAEYAQSASIQVLTFVVITMIVTPIITRKRYKKVEAETDKHPFENLK